MQEALLLFEFIQSLSWFEKSAITLLLTKLDLFQEKIKKNPIRDYFPDYTGRSDDSAAGLRFFVGRFLSLNKSRDRKIEVFALTSLTRIVSNQSSRPLWIPPLGKQKASSANSQAPAYVS